MEPPEAVTTWRLANWAGHGTEYKQTAIGSFGSQMVPIFFGQGIEFRLNHLTDTTNTNYSLQMALSYVQANTKNAEAVGQAVS